MTVENIDNGSVLLESDPLGFRPELLVFAGAGTVLEGTLIARKAVDTAITPVAGVGDTGDGTCTLASVAAGEIIPLVGSYNLECTAAVGNGGVWKLEDPNGALVADGITMTPGAGVATPFAVGGLLFTLTDGAADFIVGDSFALPVVANGNMYPFLVGGIGGQQNPISLVVSDVVAAGAGNVPIRALRLGKVAAERLVIHADGDASNITKAMWDALQDNSITVQSVRELNILDNQ